MVTNLDKFIIKPNNINEISINDILKDFSENCGHYNQVLKGGLALSYYYNDAFPSARNTIDIDFHIKTLENWENLKSKGVKNASKNSKINCIYTLGDEKKNPNGSSVVIFYNCNNQSGRFKIDMNYGTYCKTKKLNSIDIYSPEMILADKLSVICSPKIRRRTKDLYDVFLIISNEDFDFNMLSKEIKLKLNSRNLNLNNLSILNSEYLKDLEYSYYKIKLTNFPSFVEIIDKLLYFIPPIMDGVENSYNYNSMWKSSLGRWNNELFGGTFIMKSLTGAICMETASGLLELSTFPTYPVLIYNKYIDLVTSHFRFIKSEHWNEDCENISNSLLITNKEKTIIDMLENGEYRILMESLDTYLEDGYIENIEKMAVKYNKAHILKEKLNELEEYRNDLIY